jgi:hypothetical protein
MPENSRNPQDLSRGETSSCKRNKFGYGQEVAGGLPSADRWTDLGKLSECY